MPGTSKRSGGRADAQRRARESTARFMAERRDRDRKIGQLTAAFFEADLEVAEVRAALDKAEANRLAALVAIVEMDLTVAQVAELCQTDVAEVRAARKQRVDDGAGKQRGAAEPLPTKG